MPTIEQVVTDNIVLALGRAAFDKIQSDAYIQMLQNQIGQMNAEKELAAVAETPVQE